MASAELRKRLENAKRDLDSIKASSRYRQATTAQGFEGEFQKSVGIALLKLKQAEPYIDTIDDVNLIPIANYLEKIPRAIESPSSNQTQAQALIIARNGFITELPLVSYGIIEASGLLDVTGDAIRTSFDEGQKRIDERVRVAKEDIEQKAKDVLESAQRTADKISVKDAQDQFSEAGRELRRKSQICIVASAVFFFGLLGFLLWQLFHPPTLILQIVEALSPGTAAGTTRETVGSGPIPLLIAASAYFTSIRLAIVGILGIGLSFSLRMARAYLHMIEHNRHKLRVTNSIESFVAAVRTKEQKDLVLSKLVESVTDFGDSGILSKQGDSATLPSVIFDSITKNVGKSE
jgi:hypothetical protein